MRPLWRGIIEEMKAEGVDSPYLERLDLRLKAVPRGRRSGWKNLQVEILQEMAFSLGNAEDKLNMKLLQLDLLARACDQASAPEEKAALCHQFNRLREEAIRAKWELLVQRDALGFYKSPAFDKLYPIPEPRLIPVIPAEPEGEGAGQDDVGARHDMITLRRLVARITRAFSRAGQSRITIDHPVPERPAASLSAG